MNNNTAVKNILILAANPKGTSPLRLSEELREIKDGLRRRSKAGNQFLIESAEAVRYRDIHRSMLDVEPEIIHFSGHGMKEEGLVFEDEIGRAKPVDAEALAGLFELFADRVKCVVLNACYSEIQARAIAQHIDYVIGMSQAIGDRAAIEFAVGFYDALGSGKSVEFAYKLGCRVIRIAGIPENLTPKLLAKTELSNTTKQIPISNINTKPSTDGLSSESGIDYTRLRELLAARKWKQADRETADLMLKLAVREEYRWLRIEDIEKFACQDLSTIDSLWVKYSDGCFGFSVQKRIWLEVGGKVDRETELLLGDRVGWRHKGKWLEYSDLTFSLNAPKGHLPMRFVGITPARLELLSGVGTGEGAVPWCFVPSFPKPFGWVWCWAGLCLFDRIETCEL
ncbi:GUN4 domain-containing protein [Fischerella sp. PCC 9605]|uniref:GUN4 domain-containing protein n=1 Tax=Fischerella sp. PCC 9605 TaxID=1173024 RepID=UPI0004B49017|nr:GUN4 domain-containing protein [Fischerella sp. PCC 9605]